MTLDQRAAPTALADLEGALGVTMPRDYAEFLRANNGGAGWLGKWFLDLWPLEDVAPTNKAYGR